MIPRPILEKVVQGEFAVTPFHLTITEAHGHDAHVLNMRGVVQELASRLVRAEDVITAALSHTQTVEDVLERGRRG